MPTDDANAPVEPAKDGKAGEQQGQPEARFTQADIDKAVNARFAREKAAHEAELSKLRADAAKAKTVEEQLADLQANYANLQREALVSRVAAAHGVSQEDAALLLTGADEETLTAQAKRIAASNVEKKRMGNFVPSEGTRTGAGSSPLSEFASKLFGSDS